MKPIPVRAAPEPLRSARGRLGAAARRLPWWVARAGLVFALFALTACYTYTPLFTAPEPGMRVQVELNDAGRVAMENTVGPEVGRVEGRLRSRTDSQLVLGVTEVWGLYGGYSRWAGEEVSFRPTYVRTLRERRLSKGRTAVFASSVAVGVVAFIATRSLLGLGGGGNGPPGGDGGGEQ